MENLISSSHFRQCRHETLPSVLLRLHEKQNHPLRCDNKEKRIDCDYAWWMDDAHVNCYHLLTLLVAIPSMLSSFPLAHPINPCATLLTCRPVAPTGLLAAGTGASPLWDPSNRSSRLSPPLGFLEARSGKYRRKHRHQLTPRRPANKRELVGGCNGK